VDHVAKIFNPVALTILKWLRFNLLRLMNCLHHSALLNNGLGLISIVGFSWLLHITYLGDVTMEKGIAGLKYKGSVEGK